MDYQLVCPSVCLSVRVEDHAQLTNVLTYRHHIWRTDASWVSIETYWFQPDWTNTIVNTMCFITLLISSNLPGKIARVLQRESSLSSAKSNESTEQQDLFCFNHAYAFYTSKNIVKILMNSKFKVQTRTGNPIGSSRCHVLMLRVLNRSCSFEQSESRCEVIKMAF